jgi:hypothetical protein
MDARPPAETCPIVLTCGIAVTRFSRHGRVGGGQRRRHSALGARRSALGGQRPAAGGQRPAASGNVTARHALNQT